MLVCTRKQYWNEGLLNLMNGKIKIYRVKKYQYSLRDKHTELPSLYIRPNAKDSKSLEQGHVSTF